MDTTLDREWDTFRRALPTLLAEPANRGRFALVTADRIAGLYASFDEALAAGYDTFGLDPFLVQEVTDRAEPRYFSRNLRCPT
ncbi:MAG TPA: hypothetical protein VGF55_31040 [Gemmataceae bacterium]|jgi:hypothetical protein